VVTVIPGATATNLARDLATDAASRYKRLVRDVLTDAAVAGNWTWNRPPSRQTPPPNC
jgi:hypothetical protein